MSLLSKILLFFYSLYCGKDSSFRLWAILFAIKTSLFKTIVVVTNIATHINIQLRLYSAYK